MSVHAQYKDESSPSLSQSVSIAFHAHGPWKMSHLCLAVRSISSNARKESCCRTLSLSSKPRWLSVAINTRSVSLSFERARCDGVKLGPELRRAISLSTRLDLRESTSK